MTDGEYGTEEYAADQAQYRERLLPGALWWLVVAAIVAMIAIAYGAALGSTIGWTVGAGLGTIAVLALVRASPVVEVNRTHLRCGRAKISRLLVSQPRTLEPHELLDIRRGLDPSVGALTYQALPAWAARYAVLVPIDDEHDPHTAWLVGTRRPRALHDALSTPVTP